MSLDLFIFVSLVLIDVESHFVYRKDKIKIIEVDIFILYHILILILSFFYLFESDIETSRKLYFIGKPSFAFNFKLFKVLFQPVFANHYKNKMQTDI